MVQVPNVFVEKAFGITALINPHDSKDPIQQVIKNLTGGGADYSFECIGDTGMEIQADEYITHNPPFEDVNKAFNLMREGKCLRCVIHMAK
ncbi:hypothetical protein GBA52_016226 [Prunus armeniaca]|nr:hypothetical protein GBA52_016226 [Prunus armeniaca]